MTELFYDPAALIIKAALLGVVLGVIYDVFRILRISASGKAPSGAFFEKIKPKKPLFCRRKPKKERKICGKTLVFIEDVLFFLISAAAEILFFLGLNDGEIRIYCLIFTLIGFVLYLVSIGRIVIYFSSIIIFFAKCLLYWSLYIIIIPVKHILMFIKKVFAAVFAATVGKAVQRGKRRRSKSLEKAILSDAASCFGIFEEV
ncbi:MAG: spore cortex biosynthesis protein YabQ [Clostridia bacterium]|nr:spore cortex biosynthesis protein YabQ [Clostridia bacterium]